MAQVQLSATRAGTAMGFPRVRPVVMCRLGPKALLLSQPWKAQPSVESSGVACTAQLGPVMGNPRVDLDAGTCHDSHHITVTEWNHTSTYHHSTTTNDDRTAASQQRNTT